MARLEVLNNGIAALSPSDRILVQLRSPLISAFGVGFTIAGWIVDAYLVVSLGIFMIVLPFAVRNFQK